MIAASATIYDDYLRLEGQLKGTLNQRLTLTQKAVEDHALVIQTIRGPRGHPMARPSSGSQVNVSCARYCQNVNEWRPPAQGQSAAQHRLLPINSAYCGSM